MRIVSLTFHDVVANRSGAGEAFYRITAAELESLLSALRRRGFQSASSKTFCAWQRGAVTLPERTVVLTFDDGLASHFEVVVPLLLRYRFGGTFFVTTERLDQPGYLSCEQLRKLVFLGMEVGSHGHTHRPLTTLSPDELERELMQSKELIEREIGMPVRALAAPGGFWSPVVAEAVRRAGFDAAWVSTIGTNGQETNPLALRRVVVRAGFSVDHAISMVEGWQPSFWWASSQQGLIRFLKRVLGVYWYERLKRAIVPNA